MAGSRTCKPYGESVWFVWRVRLEESAEGSTVKRSGHFQLRALTQAHQLQQYLRASRDRRFSMMPTVEPRNRRVLSTRSIRARKIQERGAAFVFRAGAEGIGRNSQHWPVKRRNQPPWSLSTPPQRCRTLHTKSTGLSRQNGIQTSE